MSERAPRDFVNALIGLGLITHDPTLPTARTPEQMRKEAQSIERTCKDCHWQYHMGETGPGDKATPERCHICAQIRADYISATAKVVAERTRHAGWIVRIGVVLMIAWLLSVFLFL